MENLEFETRLFFNCQTIGIQISQLSDFRNSNFLVWKISNSKLSKLDYSSIIKLSESKFISQLSDFRNSNFLIWKISNSKLWKLKFVDHPTVSYPNFLGNFRKSWYSLASVICKGNFALCKFRHLNAITATYVSSTEFPRQSGQNSTKLRRRTLSPRICNLHDLREDYVRVLPIANTRARGR